MPLGKRIVELSQCTFYVRIFLSICNKVSHICESLFPQFNYFYLYNVALRHRKISCGQVGKVPWETTIFLHSLSSPQWSCYFVDCGRTLCPRFKKNRPKPSFPNDVRNYFSLRFSECFSKPSFHECFENYSMSLGTKTEIKFCEVFKTFDL